MRNLRQRHSTLARRNGNSFQLRNICALVRLQAENDTNLLVALQIGCYGITGYLSLQSVGHSLTCESHLQQLVIVDLQLNGVGLLQPVKTCHVDVGISGHHLAHLLRIFLNLRIAVAADADHNRIGSRRTERNRAGVNYSLRQMLGGKLADALLQFFAVFHAFGNNYELCVVITRLYRVDYQHKARCTFAYVGGNVV